VIGVQHRGTSLFIALGLFVVVSVVPTHTRAQQKATSRSAAEARAPGPIENQQVHRRKRGGLNSLPGDNTTATPAEGQSDLIKVLQPSQRTK
jgi:hypothetical protein